MPTTKFCTRCKKPQPYSEFTVNNATRDGYSYHCKPCAAVIRAEWKAKNPGKSAQMQRAHRDRDRAHYNRKMREWACRNPTRRRAYTAAVRERNRAHVNPIKLASGCVDRGLQGLDCGFITEPSLLEFDHVRGPKRANVSTLVEGCHSIAVIDAEIAKCEVVCQSHHRIRTFIRKATEG